MSKKNIKIEDFKFELRGCQWQVLFCENSKELKKLEVFLGFATPEEALKEGPVEGLCVHKHFTIMVCTDANINSIVQSVWHEIAHACIGISLLVSNSDANGMEELAVEAVANNFPSLFPQLPSWLKKVHQ